MSLLSKITSSWAFSERPIEIYQIPDLYVPFSDISNSNPEHNLETISNDTYFYLIEGPRGIGKSCFIRYWAYTFYDSEVFTILLNSFGNADYSDPNNLAKWIIDAISKAVDLYIGLDPDTKVYLAKIMANEVELGTAEEKTLAGRIGGLLHVIPQLLQFDVKVSSEIKTLAEAHIQKGYFLTDRVRCINDLIEKITSEGGFSRSLILIDGIDHINVEDVSSFATNNFPWLSSTNSSIILTSLEEYRSDPTYREQSKRARIINMPRINSEDSLIKILDKRISALEEGERWGNICDGEATKLLFEWYSSRPEDLSLRKIIRSINYAANNAIEEGSEIIMSYHMSMGIKDAI